MCALRHAYCVVYTVSMTLAQADADTESAQREAAYAQGAVSITDLVKTYPGQAIPAVKGISLDIEAGEFFTLLGPSGCGKTTTLRAVAGLESPDQGEIVVGGRRFFSGAHNVNLPAHSRGLGMVFQSYAIWPHMTVSQNVAFPLRIAKRSKRLSKTEIARRVEESLSMVQLEAYNDRPATKLSGGQQQRLALARALVAQPPVMLLDEPLSNLDAKLRDSMREQLKRLQRTLHITSIYVTHDQIEALALSNRIAVMRDGQIEQIGRPRDIYLQPRTRFVADFIGRTNFIDGTVAELRADGVMVVKTGVGAIETANSVERAVGDDVVIAVRPESIGLARAGAPTSGPNVSRAVVTNRQFLGEQTEHTVRLGDGTELTVRSDPNLSIPPGEDVQVIVPPESCRALHD
jgi:iron(III) transport system ATP-binding protein